MIFSENRHPLFGIMPWQYFPGARFRGAATVPASSSAARLGNERLGAAVCPGARRDPAVFAARTSAIQQRMEAPMAKTAHEPMAKTADEPRHHVEKMQKRLKETMDHLRADIEKVDEPRLKAMFETSAEVLGGLAKAFRDYERKNESAWR
jgi:hypothetical protein